MASATTGLSFSVSKKYQDKYSVSRHSARRKKEFQPMKPHGSPTLSFQSNKSPSTTNFPLLPQRNTKTTNKKSDEETNHATTWRKNIPNEVKTHINKVTPPVYKEIESKKSSFRPYVRKDETKTTKKSVTIKQPARISYSGSDEYDSYYSDEEYDSSYDPDEEEYNNWLRDTEDNSYGNSEYFAYEDEGFEESFY